MKDDFEDTHAKYHHLPQFSRINQIRQLNSGDKQYFSIRLIYSAQIYLHVVVFSVIAVIV